MATSAIRGDFFRVISDGERIVLLREGGGNRECYLYDNPILTNFNMEISRPMHRFMNFDGSEECIPGLADYRVDLSFRGGEVRQVSNPLVMGVDLFRNLTVTDYFDIINEKIKRR